MPRDAGHRLLVSVDRVSKRYGRTLAVDDLSFGVAKGEVLGFLGPNGAGKTTTMRVITGFMPPTEGRVLIGGLDIAEAPLEVRRRIGYLPENPPLYPEMEVRAFLEFAARLRGVPKSGIQGAVARAIERAALGEARDRIIGKLSRGYRQRVGLAQALVHEPELLVLDEPTAGLDPKQIHETRELIRALAGERTVVLSTHILPEVAVTCDRVVIIAGGRLRAEDTPEGLVARLGATRSGRGAWDIETAAPADAAVAALESVPAVLRVAPGPETAEGTTHLRVEASGDRDVATELARALIGAGCPLYGLRSSGASLEEVFLTLTTEETEARGLDEAASASGDAIGASGQPEEAA
jgi:ABC-2 type transport system ATP-binding protein